MLKISETFRNLIPALSPEETAQLEANCLAEGIREKLITWRGVIIDGHNRYEIAQKHGLEYQFTEYEFADENKAIEWIILNQFGRRNLSNYQRSVLALRLENIYAEKAKENQLRTAANLVRPMLAEQEKVTTRKIISDIAGVAHGTLSKVKIIEAAATPEVKAKVASGDVSINEAYKEIRTIEKKAELQTERARLHEIGKDKIVGIDFRLGDFEAVLSDIADGSIDCIVTDPPYPFEFIECWSKLSRFAKRVLKPNGFCIAYSGQYNLPEVISRMSENLDYYWTFAVYHEGQTQIVSAVNLICRWKPVLIFQNGKQKLPNVFQDYFISEQREKESHNWQQSKSGVGYLIEMFTNEGDTICEPFAGSGTTIQVAIAKGRKVIAAEIDEETYNIAKANL